MLFNKLLCSVFLCERKAHVSWIQNFPFSKSHWFYLIWSIPFSKIAAQIRNLNLRRIFPWYGVLFIIYIELLLKTLSWTSEFQNSEVSRDVVQRFSVCCIDTIYVKIKILWEINLIISVWFQVWFIHNKRILLILDH